jgi:hypothetical protein
MPRRRPLFDPFPLPFGDEFEALQMGYAEFGIEAQRPRPRLQPCRLQGEPELDSRYANGLYRRGYG